MSDEPMKIEINDNLCVLHFSGEVDAAAAKEHLATIQHDVSDQINNFIIDLSNVSFLDSHGVGMFVNLLKRASSNDCFFAFCGTEGQPASVLNMVGFESLSQHYASVDEALAQYNADHKNG